MAKSRGKKEGVLRLQLRIKASTHPALFEVLRDAGPYYNTKRLITLAQHGMSLDGLEGGDAPAFFPQPTEGTKPRTRAAKHKPSGDKAVVSAVVAVPAGKGAASEKRYDIPDSAADEIDELLGTFA